MKKITYPLMIFAVFSICLLASADDDFSRETVKATTITPAISMVEGAGGNITAMIGQDGTFLVDDDFAPMADKLLTKLKELKGNSPRFIVNTHFHYDHTGGNEVFGSSAIIIAANEVRNRLMTEQVLWHKTHPPVSTKALPILTFDQSLTLHINGDEVKIIHLPHGHTDGDSVVFFSKNKVASLGDLYFSGMFPIFHPEHRGSLTSYVHNIEFVLKEIPSDAKIVSGHGPLSDRSGLEKYHQMILASIATVRRGIKKGFTLSQIQKTGLDRKWESFSHGYRTTNQWLESVYGDLNGK